MHPEVPGHCVMAHGSAEGPVELGQENGRCQYEDLTR